jgi:hypothetical protein
LHRKYRPLKVGYEKYGMQSDIEHIKDCQNRINYRFDIVELGGPMPKNDRIRRLVPIYETGRFYHLEKCCRIGQDGKERDLTKDFIDEEYYSFPVGMHDDMLDCQARIVDEKLGAEWPSEKITNWDIPVNKGSWMSL